MKVTRNIDTGDEKQTIRTISTKPKEHFEGRWKSGRLYPLYSVVVNNGTTFISQNAKMKEEPYVIYDAVKKEFKAPDGWLIKEMSADSRVTALGGGGEGGVTPEEVEEMIKDKVDKVDGKGLSTNDYDNTEKNKVASAYQKPNNGIPKSDLAKAVQDVLDDADGAYKKPVTGIPFADLADGVQDSLSNADEAKAGLAGKQDTISDLSAIRSGAAAGATSVQPAEFNELRDEVGTIGNGAYEEAWDGDSTPVVADIPAGVVVTYSSASYTGTLAASASTVDKIYLVSDGNGNYDRYTTVEANGAYSWKKVGSTAIPLSNYATNTQVNQLEAKVDGNPFTKMNNNELSTNYVENSYVDTSNGNFVSYNGWARSGYINVSLFESLVINTNRASVYNGFYDKDKSFIRSFSLIVGNNNVSVPDNACFIVISNTSADVKTTAIVIGKYRYATKNDIDQSTTMFRSVSSKTLPGLTVDNYGKILSVSSSYYILYYKAEADCVVRLSYKRADSYVYDGKIFIAPESSLVVNAYVSVLTQVSQNASSDKMYTLSAGQCLCVTYKAGDMANFYLGESVLEQAKLIDSSLPKYGIEGVNLVRINAIQNNSIVNGTTGKIATDNNGWRAIEIDFCQDDVRIFMNKIWSGYYSFVDANGNVLLVQGNNYNLYWGYKIPKGAVKGRFSINANVSDADISSYCYISYGRPLMQDEISNRVSFKNSFSYAKIERPTDYNGVDITAFMKILCIGDSITRGYFNSTSGGVNIPGMSYPDNLARITGCEVTNLGDSGESTASWWAAHQNDTELTGAKCVIIELGINDDPSTLDTVTKDAMDAIIAKLKTENQKVKIFLSGIPSGKSYPARLDTDSYYVKDQWLRNYYNTYFAEDAQVFFLDIARYTHICEKKAETYDDYNQGHLSEYGYWRLAKDYANYISFLMYNSDNTFKEIQFIGTDYSRT